MRQRTWSRTLRAGLLLATIGLPLVALWLAIRAWGEPTDKLNYWAAWAQILGCCISAVGLLLVVVDWFTPSREVRNLRLAEAADELAIAVEVQWKDEVARRGLSDSWLPVRWLPSEAPLFDDWASLIRVATNPGWPQPRRDRWAASPQELSGRGRHLLDVLDKVPTGRLVVLGAPGAGKSVLLTGSVLHLLESRDGGGPVPVVVTMADWNPSHSGKGLYQWLESKLIIDHPGLADPLVHGRRQSRGRALLDAGLVLPLLDGLDERRGTVRAAIERLNEELRPGQRLVLSARTEDYREAVSPASGAEVRLTGATGVEICRLEPEAVKRYLQADGPTAEARWKVVSDVIGNSTMPVAEALSTPLMASLARTIYKSQPSDDASTPADPAELLDPIRFPTRAHVERHLFDGLFPAAYRGPAGADSESRWQAADARRWFSFLAMYLDQGSDSSSDIAWWRLPRLISPKRRWLPAITLGLSVALTGFLTGMVMGLVTGDSFAGFRGNGAVGLTVGTFGGLFVAISWRRGRAPARAPRWRPRPLWLLAATVVGAAFGIVYSRLGTTTVGIADGFAAFVVITALTLGTAPADLTVAAGPQEVLTRDRAAARSLTVIAGLSIGVVAAIAGALTFIGPVGIGWRFYSALETCVTASLTAAPAIWLCTAYGQFAVAQRWLALHDRLPRQLMPFLADAHKREVLRQVGAVYQFRHLELQHWLADGVTQASSGPAQPTDSASSR